MELQISPSQVFSHHSTHHQILVKISSSTASL
uniref:Uncharacterized protein n=1 Tax=Arundo donax TaxID=35708 RepID=A0A0A9BMI4_ARUDO